MLLHYSLLPVLVKIGAATFEVNAKSRSQNIAKKYFQRQLTVPPHKQVLLYNT